MGELQKTFSAGFADDTMTAAEIRRIFEHTGYLMDPHTAVASHVLAEYRDVSGDHSPTVIVSTASPYKFSEDVLSSLLGKEATEGLDAFACAEKLHAHTGVPIPSQILELKTLPIRHKTVCERDGMEGALLNELQ